MTPTNEQVVAACQRAGMDVFSIGSLLFIDEYEISENLDSCPGSARFIVAVLGALDKAEVIRGDKGRWRVGGRLTTCEALRIYSDWHDTLTAACMAAIVAAYPPEEKA